MDGRPPHEAEEYVSAMNPHDLDLIMKKLTSRGFQEVALQYRKTRTEQVRFSQNSEDLHNDWDESSVSVFAASRKKTVSTTIADMGNVDATIDKLWNISVKIPDNLSFEGINP